jgi:hypothetical protein
LETVRGLIGQHANFADNSIPNTLGLTDQFGRVINTTLMGTLRPFQQFFGQSIISTYDRRGNSNYNGVYISVKKRFAGALFLQASYTASKAIDDSTNPTFGSLSIYGGTPMQDPTNLRAERSLSINDIPQKLIVGYSYELPAGKGRGLDARNRVLNYIIGGWRTGGLFTLQKSFPFSIQLGSPGYWFSQGGGNNLLPPGVTLRPNIVPGVPLINPDWRKDPFNIPIVNSAAFSIPGSLDHPEFGNAPRTLPNVRGPHLTYFDLSLTKKLGLRGERPYLQLRADVLNALNRPGFLFNPNGGHAVLSPSFNPKSLTDPSTPPYTLQPAFGKVSQPNTTPGRSIKIEVALVF